MSGQMQQNKSSMRQQNKSHVIQQQQQQQLQQQQLQQQLQQQQQQQQRDLLREQQQQKVVRVNILKLPKMILFEIISFLPWQEVYYNLSHSCQDFFRMLHDPIFIRYFMNKYVLNGSARLINKFEQAKTKEIIQFLLNNYRRKRIELPFWGHKTDGGIYQNIFNYYVEKAFSKSQNQMVAYKKVKNVHIEGTLAQDIIDFKSIMEQMSEKLKSYYFYYNIKTENIPTQFSKINIDRIFYQYYQGSQNSTYLEESGRKFWNHFLYYDSLLEKALDKDDLKISQPFTSLKNTVSQISSIEISRKGSFRRPVKTLVIFYLEETTPSPLSSNKSKISPQPDKYQIVKYFDDIDNYGKLKLFMYKNPSLLPSIVRESGVNGCKSVLFKRNEKEHQNQFQPLLWLHFTSDKTANFKTKLTFNEQVLATTVLLKIIDHTHDDVDLCGPDYDQTFQEPLQGPGFSYVSFKGVLINSKSFTAPKKAKKPSQKNRPVRSIRVKTNLDPHH